MKYKIVRSDGLEYSISKKQFQSKGTLSVYDNDMKRLCARLNKQGYDCRIENVSDGYEIKSITIINNDGSETTF